jgi:hypothetical protein
VTAAMVVRLIVTTLQYRRIAPSAG